MDSDLTIPDFLKISAETRAEAWAKNPPRPFVADVKRKEHVPSPELAAILEEQERRKAIRAANRKGVDRGTKPIPGSHWDQRRGMWVHPTIEKEKAKKLGTALYVRILTEGNPRAEGTKAHARFDELRRYLKKNPRASLADVLAKTSYTKTDLDWDKKRGDVDVVEA